MTSRQPLLDRSAMAVAAFGAAFSAFAVWSFFSTLARQSRNLVSGYGPLIALLVTMVVLPYLSAAIAQSLSRTERASWVNLVLIILFVVSSVLFYGPRLTANQDEEHAVVFLLPIVQFALALIGLAYVLVQGKRADQ